MRNILNYYKPLTGKLQHSVFLLNEKEFASMAKSYGIPVPLKREYRECIPSPFRISGIGWSVKDEVSAKESVYIRKSTHKTENI